MNTDYSYCSGVTCSIRKSCKRYLPDPPDTRLQWVWPAYNPETDKCKYYEPTTINSNKIRKDMKKRLAKKILYVTSVFGNWDSNYQPYSIPQQQKALKVLKIPMDIRDTILEYGVFGKIPVEYRKYNPVEIFQIMLSKNMNPGSVKEFRRCMKQILNK